MNIARAPEASQIEPALKYAFSPVHKAALGTAFGLVCGTLVAGTTIAQLAVLRTHGSPLALLGQFFYGYDVSWSGAVVGFLWAFVVGFVAGWFLAFMKNFLTALWMFGLRVRSALTQPFLDHI